MTVGGLLRSTTLSVSIKCPSRRVYAFISDGANLPKWGTTFVKSIRESRGAWIAHTPQGPVTIRLAKKNSQGIIDHWVRPSDGPEVFVPMRVVSNGRGSEVLFTIFRQPHMSDESYANESSPPDGSDASLHGETGEMKADSDFFPPPPDAR